MTNLQLDSSLLTIFHSNYEINIQSTNTNTHIYHSNLPFFSSGRTCSTWGSFLSSSDRVSIALLNTASTNCFSSYNEMKRGYTVIHKWSTLFSQGSHSYIPGIRPKSLNRILFLNIFVIMFFLFLFSCFNVYYFIKF